MTSRPFTADDLEAARALAVQLLSFAVNDSQGRTEDDAVYKVITENRDVGRFRASYSSCADLAHWYLRCMGVRAPWINRDDDGDAKKWRSAVNLNWLCPPPIGPCKPAKAKLSTSPEIGDVFVENNAFGGHVFCAISYDAPTDTLTTAEYGQPGGLRKVRRGFTAAFAKRPLSHLRLADVLVSGLCTVAPDVTAGRLPSVPPPAVKRPTLRRGSSGADVTTLQTVLGITADGSFGPLTEYAVRRAQGASGLVSDGVVGPATWRALGFS